MHRLPCVLLLALTVFFAGCGDESSPSPPVAEDPTALDVAQPLRIDAIELKAEIAIHLSEQRQGLMFRKSLKTDHGMIFIYSEPTQMSFWMKNTLIPLDIGFFDGTGKLLQVARMYPRDRNSVSSTSDQIQWALEMDQGWFRAKGLTPGAQLDLDLLRKAIAARGVNPKKYGL